MRLKIVIVFLIVIAIFASDVTIENRLDSAMEMFKSGDYETSENILSSLRSTARGTQYFPTTAYLQALSAYKGKKYERAAEQFHDFATSFPEHPLKYRAVLYRANSLYRIGNSFEASRNYIQVLQSANKREVEIAKKSLERLLTGHLTLSELKSLSAQVPSQHQIYISIFYLERLRSMGQYALAIRESDALIRNFPGHPEIREIQMINRQLQDQISGSITVGILLPLSGTFAEFGQSVLDGINLAFDSMKRDRSVEVTLEVMDSNADPLRCVQEAEKLIQSKSPLCIIGPLLSEEAVALGTLGGAHRIPIISPTATQSGLASISPYFFQVAASPRNATRALMFYAIEENQDSTFAILCPNDRLGRMLAETAYGILDVREREIIAVEYYQPGEVDYSDVLALIKEPILERMDRQVVRASDTNLVFYDERGVLRDRREWEVDIDAIFIPGYIDELINLLPQIPFNYINTRVLGTNEWIVDELRERNIRKFSSGAQFVPDQFFVGDDSPQWRRFSDKFNAKYRKPPNNLAALGYDAATLVTTAIEQKNITNEMLREYLANVRNFAGVSCDIDFDGNGENTRVRIYEFDDGKLIRLK